MAITKLNSLAIPAGTVEPADISYPLTNFSSTGIDDNASSNAITIDSSGNIEVSGNFSSTVTGIDGNGDTLTNIGATISATKDGSIVNNVFPADLIFSTNGGSSSVTERMRIDSDGNVGINETTPSGLTGNTSGVGTSTKFKVTGSVGSTQIANTGNLIAFSRDAANYISATGSSASLIYDSPTHYFKSGANTYATLNDNLVLDGGFTRTNEYQWNDGGRYVRDFSGIASYWSQNEYIELFTVTPSGASQNYFIEGDRKSVV